jgi:hypothetical protein
VAQAAFARALEQRHRFSGGDARTWFYTIGLRPWRSTSCGGGDGYPRERRARNRAGPCPPSPTCGSPSATSNRNTGRRSC